MNFDVIGIFTKREKLGPECERKKKSSVPLPVPSRYTLSLFAPYTVAAPRTNNEMKLSAKSRQHTQFLDARKNSK